MDGSRFLHDHFAFDLHGHLEGLFPRILKIANKGTMPKDFRLVELTPAGLNGFVLTVLGDPNVFRPMRTSQDRYVLHRLDEFHKVAKAAGVEIALDAESLDPTSGKPVRAAVLGVEGADFLDSDLELLDIVYQKGVRVLQLVHYGKNSFGSIGLGWKGRIPTEEEHTGLTEDGRRLCRRCNEMGVLLDLSHADERTLAGALDASISPIMVSHTGPRSRQQFFPRFISDDAMRRVADGGGVIGLWLFRLGNTGTRSLEEFADNLKHCLDLVGAEHLGIGTDINGVPGNAEGYENPHDYSAIVDTMIGAGLSEDQIGKIVGLNFIRILQAVESNRLKGKSAPR